MCEMKYFLKFLVLKANLFNIFLDLLLKVFEFYLTIFAKQMKYHVRNDS